MPLSFILYVSACNMFHISAVITTSHPLARQLLRFELYDWDVKVHSVTDQDFLGRVTCSVGEVVSAGRKVGDRGVFGMERRLRGVERHVAILSRDNGNKSLPECRENGAVYMQKILGSNASLPRRRYLSSFRFFCLYDALCHCHFLFLNHIIHFSLLGRELCLKYIVIGSSA